MQDFINGLNSFEKLLLVIAVAALAHIFVRLVRYFTSHAMGLSSRHSNRKVTSLLSLISSALIFGIYFAALGFVMNELGMPITAYLASASIIGLAVGFGSQGLVQDVVTGLTSIFSDIYDLGDMVEIGGQVGVVRKIGLRFLEIESPLGARVMFPNRSIISVVNYRRGYLRCIVDITIPHSTPEDNVESVCERLMTLAHGVHEQFPGILLTPPSRIGLKTNASGRSYLRLKFRIWPGRGAPIEQSFKQEATQEMRLLEPSYKEWMVAIYNEVENRPH